MMFGAVGWLKSPSFTGGVVIVSAYHLMNYPKLFAIFFAFNLLLATHGSLSFHSASCFVCFEL